MNAEIKPASSPASLDHLFRHAKRPLIQAILITDPLMNISLEFVQSEKLQQAWLHDERGSKNWEVAMPSGVLGDSYPIGRPARKNPAASS